MKLFEAIWDLILFGYNSLRYGVIDFFSYGEKDSMARFRIPALIFLVATSILVVPKINIGIYMYVTALTLLFVVYGAVRLMRTMDG